MTRMRVGVLRGGPSYEYEVSLKTGAAVLANLSSERYEVLDVFIDRTGVWHIRGKPILPDRSLRIIDCAFIALHGQFGEDGAVQRLLEAHQIPFTGSRALAASLAMNKALSKACLARVGVNVPFGRVVSARDVTSALIHELFRTFPQPSVVKPLALGSSVGVSVARSFDNFHNGIIAAAEVSDRILLEEYIAGVEVTVGVIENFRGETHYVLPGVEVVPHHGHSFFDYSAKYEGNAEEICPARLSSDVREELSRLAQLVHTTLGLRHYSRSDFIVSPRGIYFLECNTLPGLTSTSLFPKALDAVGSSLPEFLDHVISCSLTRT